MAGVKQRIAAGSDPQAAPMGGTATSGAVGAITAAAATSSSAPTTDSTSQY